MFLKYFIQLMDWRSVEGASYVSNLFSYIADTTGFSHNSLIMWLPL